MRVSVMTKLLKAQPARMAVRHEGQDGLPIPARDYCGLAGVATT